MRFKLNIGVVGVGAMGKVLVRLWSAAGYPVKVVARDQVKLAHWVARLDLPVGTGALSDIVGWADIVVLALPYHSLPSVLPSLTPPGLMVLDITSPYHWDQQGKVYRALPASWSGGEALAQRLPHCSVIKAFSTLPPEVIRLQAHQPPARLAVPYATNTLNVQPTVEQLIIRAGFDPVFVGGLLQCRHLELFGALFSQVMTAQQLRALLPDLR